MTQPLTPATTRRRFVGLATATVGGALLAACSPPPAPPATPVAAPPAPEPAPAPVPAPAPAAAPTASPAPAGGVPRLVAETDPAAVALGYVEDANRVDAARHPTRVAGSNCANCALYQGRAGDTHGPCPLFAGASVAAAGWCTAWARKA